MKKPQINLDLTKVKSVLGAHIEKIGIAVAVALFLWFGLKAVQRETFEQRPEELESLVVQAKNNVAQSRWESVPDRNVDIPAYAEEAENSRDPIKMVVKTFSPLNPPTFGAKAKRGEPKFLAANSLEVSAGFGAFVTDSDTKGYRYAIVKALVPWDEQVNLYDAALREAEGWDVENDRPRYLGCHVQRYAKDAAGEWKRDGNWIPFRYESALTRSNDDRWAEFWPPMVSFDLVADEDLVYPLGPLADAQWGNEVTHTQIPLIDEFGDDQAWEQQEDADDARDADEVRNGGLADHANQIAERGPARRAGAAQIAFQEDDPFGAARRGDQAAADEIEQQQPDDFSSLPPHRLVRVFDFNVKPGMQYRYKIRLIFENPNAHIEKRLLEDPEYAEKGHRYADWSELSPVVDVPRDSDVLAVGGTKRVRGADPKADVIVYRWDEKQGVLVPRKRAMIPGEVANFVEKDPWAVLGAESPNSQIMAGDVAVETDTMLIDAVGGNKLPGSRSRLFEPSEMLFIDAKGRLYERGELADRDEFDSYASLIDDFSGETKKTRPKRVRKKGGGGGLAQNLDIAQPEEDDGGRRRNRNGSDRNNIRGGGSGGLGRNLGAGGAQRGQTQNNRPGSGRRGMGQNLGQPPPQNRPR